MNPLFGQLLLQRDLWIPVLYNQPLDDPPGRMEESCLLARPDIITAMSPNPDRHDVFVLVMWVTFMSTARPNRAYDRKNG